MIHANPSKQPKIMQQNYKNMNPQEDHLVDTKCHSIDCSLKFKRKSMKTVDDKSAKCLMSIYQIGQRSDNRTKKYELSNKRIIQWTRNVSVLATVGTSNASLRICSVLDSSIVSHYFSTCFSSESGLFFL